MPRRPLVAALIALLGVLPSTALAARPDGERARIKEYWTKERMQRALPRAKGKPGGGGGGKTTTYVRSAVENPTGPANRTSGKVFITFGRTDYVCSGTSVASRNDSLVWTAGHCVYDRAAGGYAENFLFVPAYDNGAEPFGRYAAPPDDLDTTTQFETSESFAHDFGAARVGTNGNGTKLGAAVGERALDFSPTRTQAYTLYGYPVSRATAYGRVMYQCATNWAVDDTSLDPPAIGVDCNWPGGSSGGAWIGENGALATVTSYGYLSQKERVYGSYPGDSARALHEAAER